MAESLIYRYENRSFGLGKLPKPADLAARGGVWFACGAIQLHLGVERDFKPALNAHPGLIMDRLAPNVANLNEAGYPVKSDVAIDGFTRMFTADPFGNRIELLDPVR